eukprot:gene10995-14716_t
MFNLIVVLAAFASAAAFSVSPSRAARSSSLKMGFEDTSLLLVSFWDPLGLLNDADQAKFDRLRTVETKHGRIAQLAILGHLVTT